MRYIWSLKWSLVGFAAAFLLSFLSFGLLGYVLYYAAYPVVGMAYPPLSAWRPDTVWPLIVGAGLVWSFSFIPAGVIDHALAGRGVARAQRNICVFRRALDRRGSGLAVSSSRPIFPRYGTETMKESG